MNLVKLSIHEHLCGVDFKIQNIGELDQKTIDKLQDFALKRNGYFRADLACFDIKRKLRQKQILQIFELLEISIEVVDAVAIPTEITPASQKLIEFGKYKGFRWCDVPLNYLEWLYKENEDINAYGELKRRRDALLDIEKEIIKFGKHKGAEWIKLPQDYLEWVVNHFPRDQEAHKIAKHSLEYQQNSSESL